MSEAIIVRDHFGGSFPVNQAHHTTGEVRQTLYLELGIDIFRMGETTRVVSLEENPIAHILQYHLFALRQRGPRASKHPGVLHTRVISSHVFIGDSRARFLGGEI